MNADTCQSLAKLQFSQSIFEKTPKFQKSSNSTHWEPSCPMQTDRHDEANSRSSKFCERAYNGIKQQK